MVKTTKILLIFLQTFEGNVGKKIFFGVFVGKEENRKGAIKPWPLCTPLGLFLGVLGCCGVRLLTCVCMLRCWMCEVEPMCVDADGVGCGRRGALLSPGWEDVYMDVAVAWLRGCVYGCCCRLVEGMCIWMRMVLGWTARRVAVAWLRIFFIFCLRRGGGYMYS